MNKTKTFIQNLWYQRETTGEMTRIFPPGADTAPLDEQVNAWVEKTAVNIVHPGQLGIHTSWSGTAENPFQLQCVTLGQVVLYEDGTDDERDSLYSNPRRLTLPGSAD